MLHKSVPLNLVLLSSPYMFTVSIETCSGALERS